MRLNPYRLACLLYFAPCNLIRIPPCARLTPELAMPENPAKKTSSNQTQTLSKQ